MCIRDRASTEAAAATNLGDPTTRLILGNSLSMRSRRGRTPHPRAGSGLGRSAQTPTDGVIGLGELKIRSVAHRQAEISYAVHTVLWSEDWSIRSAILAQASLSSRFAGIGVAMALPFIRRTRASAWRSRQGARCLTFKVTPATRCWNLTTWQRERSSRWHQQGILADLFVRDQVA